ELAAAQATWDKSLAKGERVQWSPAGGLLAHYPLDGEVPGNCKFEDGTAAWVDGPLGKAADFDGKRFLNAGDLGDFGFYDHFSCAAWVNARDAKGGSILSRMADVPRGEGWNVCLVDGRVQVQLTKRWLDDALRVETENAIPVGEWHHVLATYDGSRVAAGVKVYVDGRPQKLKVLLDELNQTFATKEPLRVGGGGGPEGRFRGAVADVRIYHEDLPAEDGEVIATPDTITPIAPLSRAKPTPAPPPHPPPPLPHH